MQIDPTGIGPIPGLSAQGYLILAVLAQLITFAGVVVGLIFTFLRDSRTRRWLEADRSFLAQQTVAAATDVKTHATQAAESFTALLVTKSAAVETHLTQLNAEVQATKKAAGDAYSEANHVNQKLQSLGLERTQADERFTIAVAAGVKAALLEQAAKAAQAAKALLETAIIKDP